MRTAAARRLQIEEAKAEVRVLIAFGSFEGVTDPLAVLSELANRALATERALAVRANDLYNDQRHYRRRRAGTEQLCAEVACWERWLKQEASTADSLAKHNFEERRVRISEV